MDDDGWDDLDAASVDMLAEIERKAFINEPQAASVSLEASKHTTQGQTCASISFGVFQSRQFPEIGKRFQVPAKENSRPLQGASTDALTPSFQRPQATAAPSAPTSEAPYRAQAPTAGPQASSDPVPSSNYGGHQASEPPPAKRILLSASCTVGPNCTVDFFLPYNEALRSKVDELGCLSWIQRTRVWRTSAKNYDRVKSALTTIPSVQLRIEELHAVPLKVLKNTAERSDDSERYKSIPANLEASLMSFQRDGVRFALKRGCRVLVGDEMGLGKTVQAIALLAVYKDRWPALIIAPSSLKEQWADALHQWLGVVDRRIQIIHTGKDVEFVRHYFARKDGPTRDFLIISYTFVTKMRPVLEEVGFKFVILDESHYIKDAKAQRTKDTLPLVENTECAVLLSGTPMVSRPKEMMTQLGALVPEAKLKLKDFGERYCLSTNQRFGKYDGCCNHDELNKLLVSTVMVRRLKKEVLDQLPPKRRQQVFLTLDKPDKDRIDKQSAAMDAARSMMAASGDESAASSCMRQEQRKLIMDLYRLTAEVKVKVVQQYVGDLLDQDQKFLIFCHHKVMNDGIAEVLNKKKVDHICIDGSVPPDKRQGLVQRFQADHRVKVALLSIKAAGVGLTLTAASMVVFAELAWSPGDITQAEDRAHRIGQPSSVNIYFLHVKQSIDDIMWSLIQSKLGNVGQAINGCKESFEMTAQTEQRDANQASLRGFLNTAAPSDGASQPSERGYHNTNSAQDPKSQRQTGLHAYMKPAKK